MYNLEVNYPSNNTFLQNNSLNESPVNRNFSPTPLSPAPISPTDLSQQFFSFEQEFNPEDNLQTNINPTKEFNFLNQSDLNPIESPKSPTSLCEKLLEDNLSIPLSPIIPNQEPYNAEEFGEKNEFDNFQEQDPFLAILTPFLAIENIELESNFNSIDLEEEKSCHNNFITTKAYPNNFNVEILSNLEPKKDSEKTFNTKKLKRKREIPESKKCAEEEKIINKKRRKENNQTKRSNLINNRYLFNKENNLENHKEESNEKFIDDSSSTKDDDESELVDNHNPKEEREKEFIDDSSSLEEEGKSELINSEEDNELKESQDSEPEDTKLKKCKNSESSDSKKLALAVRCNRRPIRTEKLIQYGHYKRKGDKFICQHCHSVVKKDGGQLRKHLEDKTIDEHYGIDIEKPFLRIEV